MRNRGLLVITLALVLAVQPGCVYFFLTSRSTAQKIERHPSKRINYIAAGFGYDALWILAGGIGIAFFIYDILYLSGWLDTKSKSRAGRQVVPLYPPFDEP